MLFQRIYAIQFVPPWKGGEGWEDNIVAVDNGGVVLVEGAHAGDVDVGTAVTEH